MTATLPDSLFKYMGLSPRALQQLCMGEVYYSDPSNFNDPLDCRPAIKVDLPIPDLENILADLVLRRVSLEVSDTMKRLRFKTDTIAARQEQSARQVFNTLLRNIHCDASHSDITNAEVHIKRSIGNAIEYELRRAYGRGVFCLSKRYDSPLMWSHYADQHRGICVEFDLSTADPKDIGKVQYGDSREVLASTVRRWLNDDNDQSRLALERTCLLTKSSEWCYEDEYRFLGHVGLRQPTVPFKSITFGMKCDRALEYTVIAALGGAGSGLSFYRISTPGARFELTRDEIDVQETLAGMPRINSIQEFENLDHPVNR